MSTPLHLSRAIELARASVARGGGPFGAVITRGDEVLAEAANAVVPNHDPTAHAEIQAIRAACAKLGTHVLEGCELWSSCEPCPMCLSAAWWARLERVHFAADRDQAAAAGFDDRALYEEVATPLDARKLPIVHHPGESGQLPFDDWRALEDRAEY